KDIIYLDEEDEDFINKNDIWNHTNNCSEQEEDTQKLLRDENEENLEIERLKIRKIENTNTGDDIVSIVWSETSEDLNELTEILN
ncbi:1966_t:CDS:2, partial [Ambispora gerdemannii]